MQVQRPSIVAMPAQAEAQAQAANVELVPQDTLKAMCRQYNEEHQAARELGYVSQFMSFLLGTVTVRRVSNFFACFGFSSFYPAQRNYPVIPAGERAEQLAKLFVPKLSTMSVVQSKSDDLKPNNLYYEVLPPKEERNYFSLLYYLGAETERVPTPIINWLYEKVRAVWYGSQKDWEAIQINLDPKTFEPIGICYETSNYSGNPNGYHLMNASDLHLKCSILKQEDGSWEQCVEQKNGEETRAPIANPFESGPHLPVTIVSWNGAFDVTSKVEEQKSLKVYELDLPQPKYLDINTYREEGMDLRVGWLQERKFGRFMLSRRHPLELKLQDASRVAQS